MSTTSPSFFALRHLRVALTDTWLIVTIRIVLLGLCVRARLHLGHSVCHLDLALLIKSEEHGHSLFNLVFIAELSCLFNLVGNRGGVILNINHNVSLHGDLLPIFTLSGRVNHNALGGHSRLLLGLHVVHVLHIVEIARVHLLHHVVYLVVLFKTAHVVSIVKCGLRKLWIHKLSSHVWIHKHLSRHRHAHLLLIGLIEMALILVLVIVLVVEVLTHVRVVVHSHIVKQ